MSHAAEKLILAHPHLHRKHLYDGIHKNLRNLDMRGKRNAI